MSTSPSWFDQEKFSRLVKKVGPKPVTGALPGQPGVEPESRPGEGGAPTSRISLVSKSPSLLSAEHRTLPALPRRTTPLPSLKALFSSPPPSHPSPQPPAEAPVETAPGGEETGQESGAPFSPKEEDLAELWQKMGMLNEELARAIQDRDQAVRENTLLREQLSRPGEASTGGETPAGAAAELTEELARVTEERDQSRREYIALRQEFETLKQEQTAQDEPGKLRESGRLRFESGQRLEELRQKLVERDEEIAALKASSAGATEAESGGEGDEKLKEQIASLREQVARAKDEASIAQRGLALSQKALHETRDTLREATEGTSLSRHNFDNLKNECATLSQQNAVLQAQNDQLSRDLAAIKAKSTTRL